ncbi:MAG: ATP-binding protein [Bacteriovoracia bacterium]
MTSIYSVILSILKRGLALSLGAAGLALLAYSVYSLKKTETQAMRFVTNHVAALAEAGVNSQNVNEIDKEIARFTQTWKETQDLDLRVDISLDGKLISHAGQLQPFGIFHSRVEETTPLPSGQMLSIIVEVSLASFIQSGVLLLASIALFIGCVFLVLMWWMRRMTINLVIGPLENRIQWLKFVAKGLPDSAHAQEPPVARSQILEIEELTTSISTLLKQIVVLERNLATVGMDKLRLALAEQVAHAIKGVIATLQLRINEIPNLSLKDKRSLNDCVASLKDVSGSLLNRSSAANVLAESISTQEPIHILSTIKTVSDSKRAQYASLRASVEFVNESAFFGSFCAMTLGDLETVFATILDNAFEAIGTGGRITIAGTKVEETLEIRFKDNGTGIPQEVLSKLLSERITFGKPHGNGIGLTHAKEVLQKVGGSIQIESSIGEGTTVAVRIPLSRKVDLFLDCVELPAKGKVVIVDDDSLIHSLWQRRLSELGTIPSEVVHLSSVEAFTNWIEANGHGEFGERLYLFDCDLKDEDASGLDLIERFGLSFESILISGMAENAEVRSRTNRLGVRWLSKDYLGIVPVISGGQPEKASFLGVI